MKQMKLKSYWIQILELIDWLIFCLSLYMKVEGCHFNTSYSVLQMIPYIYSYIMRIYEKWFVIHMEPIMGLDLDL